MPIITVTAGKELGKLKELILYVTYKCQEKSNFGSTLLNKILFYADFYSYAFNHKPITEATYRADDYGMVPVELIEARGELVDEGRLEVRSIDCYGREQKRPMLTQPFEPLVLSKEEREFVDGIIETFGAFTGKEISELNHKEVAYAFSRYGERIPYNRIYALGPVEVPLHVQQWAVDTARKLGYEYSM